MPSTYVATAVLIRSPAVVPSKAARCRRASMCPASMLAVNRCLLLFNDAAHRPIVAADLRACDASHRACRLSSFIKFVIQLVKLRKLAAVRLSVRWYRPAATGLMQGGRSVRYIAVSSADALPMCRIHLQLQGMYRCRFHR